MSTSTRPLGDGDRNPDGDRDQAAPTVLGGRYELSRLLGRGGMSEVHLGRDLELGRRVAVKLLPRDAVEGLHDAERLRGEARAAAALNHRNVVGVYDIGTTADSVFVVMEYLDGEPLGAALRRNGPMPPETAVGVAAEICLALDAAHRAGVVHRDISPGNVMLCSDGGVKVMDFGIARMAGTGGRTVTGQVLGTPAYLSPEQARGTALDARSDLYSLGCCLYAMLTGRPPFDDTSPLAVLHQHVAERPRPPRSLDPAIPAALESVILRALAKDPDERYATASAMRAALLHAAEAPQSTLALPLPTSGPAPASAPAPRNTAETIAADRTEQEHDDGADTGRLRRWAGLALIALAVLLIAVVLLNP